MTIADEYDKHRPKFQELLEAFSNMLYGYVARIMTAKNLIVQTEDSIRLVHRALYRAEPAAEQIAVTEIERFASTEINRAHNNGMSEPNRCPVEEGWLLLALR